MTGPEPTQRGVEAMSAVALRVIETAADPVPLSLHLAPDTSFDDWVTVGRRLCLGSQAVNWHIGDWWRHGVKHYGEEETRAAAIDIWGVESETARVYGWVAEKFDPVTRVTQLPFSHYKAVASLPQAEAAQLIRRAASEHLTVRDLRMAVRETKAANDPERSAAPQPAPTPEPMPASKRCELEEAYSRYVEAMEAIEAYRPLTKREADFLTIAEDFLGEAHDGRREVPVDFKVVFVEQGRLACEAWYRASRITVNRWLLASGKRKLLEERASYVRFQRSKDHPAATKPQQPQLAEIDVLLPVARMAADFLRKSCNGGWRISKCQDGNGWFVGTVRRSSDELITMATNQGFDRKEAEAIAEAEGN